MLLDGKIGDFMIYEKTQGTGKIFKALKQGGTGIRIAYVGQKLGEPKIGKIMVNTSNIGGKRKYSIENSDGFYSVSELIDNVGDDYCQWLKNPFLGLNE